jgi:hypothetical protein
MLKTKIAVLAATGMMASCVGAENTTEANIRKNIEPRLGGAKIDSITETPYSGLYELRVGGDILYTDKKGEFLFIGQVYEAKTSKNLTKARIDDLNKIKFSDLPLNLRAEAGEGRRQARHRRVRRPELRLLQAPAPDHAQGPEQRHHLHLHVQHPVRGFVREVEEHLVRAEPGQGLGRLDDQR